MPLPEDAQDQRAAKARNQLAAGEAPMRVGDLFKMIGEMLGKELTISYQNDPNSGHYQVTPYAFMPKVGRKLVPPLTVDLGQGILRVMNKGAQAIVGYNENVAFHPDGSKYFSCFGTAVMFEFDPADPESLPLMMVLISA